MTALRLCEWPVWIGTRAVPCGDPIGPDLRRTWCERHTEEAQHPPVQPPADRPREDA